MQTHGRVTASWTWGPACRLPLHCVQRMPGGRPWTAHARATLPLASRQGTDLTDTELVDLISEMCVMSKSLEAYEGELQM